MEFCRNFLEKFKRIACTNELASFLERFVRRSEHLYSALKGVKNVESALKTFNTPLLLNVLIFFDRSKFDKSNIKRYVRKGV